MLENEAHCKNCLMATIKVYMCYSVKIYKYRPPKNSKIPKMRASAGSAFVNDQVSVFIVHLQLWYTKTEHLDL